MVKFLKPGRVVVLLAGRHAGKKAVIVKQMDDGTKKGRRFPHCIVAGIARYPKKVTKRMGKKKIAKKSKVKPFVKHVNYSHIMPTRYILGQELDLKAIVTEEALGKPEDKKNMSKKVKELFEGQYTCLLYTSPSPRD
eukprot:TRINITY_DN5032_c0_g1_i13.p1 TRINITY_DN5032_c0_g1~~TRINITY_DN5032_c0_g1_i13.p1  ORF type:complete len:137 (-),score=59.41 TRINITY_DN5032_c0_g1_i13:81-491(-)